MKCLQAGCDVGELRSSSDKPCKSRLNILKPGSITDDKLRNRELQ